MSEWWREAAWMQLPDGTVWIHPQTVVERLAFRRIRLTAHKVRGYSVTVPVTHPLAQGATK